MIGSNQPAGRAGAFTLVEVMVSMAIMAILLVSAMRLSGAAGLDRQKTSQRAVASGLADELMADIQRCAYSDPTSTPLFGVEAGESASNKTTFDDVDDFNGWTENTIQSSAGVARTDLARWTRKVVVEWVNPAAPTTTSTTATGVKRITVTVLYNGMVLATRVAIRTAAP
jgi:prepilin-type N-terminal cleavage/methylation domain-containing protein